MPPASTQQPGPWLAFSLLTDFTWGFYGVLLHTGQVGMHDGVNGRYKAFLFVGLAYVLVAVIAPFLMLCLSGANWKFPAEGMAWSLIAGIAGAIGAFGILLAFGAKGQPPVVMAIVFAGAPVVNAITALLVDPPEGGWSAIPWQFWLGIALAASGGTMVTYNKPPPGKAHGAPHAVVATPKAP